MNDIDPITTTGPRMLKFNERTGRIAIAPEPDAIRPTPARVANANRLRNYDAAVERLRNLAAQYERCIGDPDITNDLLCVAMGIVWMVAPDVAWSDLRQATRDWLDDLAREEGEK